MREGESTDHSTHHDHKKHASEKAAAANAPVGLKNTVRGMAVNAQSPHVHEHGGQRGYFCSTGCRSKFIADPAKYLRDSSARSNPQVSAPPVAAGTIYICPMHPEVRQDHPGACPRCGMALEPEMPSLDEGDNPELADFSRRFWWTLPLTVAVTLIAMLGHRLQWFQTGAQSWIELGLSLPIVLWAG